MGNRDLSQPTTRNVADDNDEFRDLGVEFSYYPYTYPFTYPIGRARELADKDVRSLSATE